MPRIHILFKVYVKWMPILFVLLYACQGEVQPDQSTVAIEVSFDEGAFFDIDELVEMEAVIQLETREDCAIGSINKLLYDGHRFYIMDRRSKVVFCFHQDGTFIEKIGRQGRGPQEFLTVKDICLSLDNNQLFVLDYRKVHVYHTETLDYAGTIEIDFDGKLMYNPDALAVIDPKNMYFWVQSPDSREKVSDFFHLIHYKERAYNYFYPYNEYGRGTSSRFTRKSDDNGYYCVLPMDDMRVLAISQSGNVGYAFNLNFPDPIPQNYLDQTNMNSSPNALMKTPFNKLIHRFYETNQYILFRFAGKDAYTYEGLIQKVGNQLTIGKRKTDFPVIQYAYDDDYFGSMLPHNAIKHLVQDDSNSFIQALSGLKIDELDNPIIFRFRLR